MNKKHLVLKKNGLGVMVPLDKITPAPIKLDKPIKGIKIEKLLELPSHVKWSNYDRKLLIPFTINPADSSKKSPFTKNWDELSSKSKKRRIIEHFTLYNDSFEDYYICYEFSSKGRFHCHGFIKLFSNSINWTNYYHFVEQTYRTFGARKNKKACYKGVPLNSHTDVTFDKCYNYHTKDVNVVFKSMYRIKWTSKSGINAIITKKTRTKLNTQSLGY